MLHIGPLSFQVTQGASVKRSLCTSCLGPSVICLFSNYKGLSVLPMRGIYCECITYICVATSGCMRILHFHRGKGILIAKNYIRHKEKLNNMEWLYQMWWQMILPASGTHVNQTCHLLVVALRVYLQIRSPRRSVRSEVLQTNFEWRSVLISDRSL